MWFDKLWQNTVDLFRSLDIPVRTLECCSGDLADLKVKSVDVEAWSPRQKKYFEVGSCSNLGDANGAFFVLAAPSHELFCMDGTRFARFAKKALRGAWPPVPAFLDTPFIFAIYY